MCPKGDDPFTPSSDYKTIIITTNATTGYLNGTFKFSFFEEYFNFPANSSLWDEESCVTAFEGLRNIERVTCTRAAVGGDSGSTYTVQLRAFPSFPYENNFFSHDGNPSIGAFKCDTSSVSTLSAKDVKCSIAEVAVNSLPGTCPTKL